MNHQRSLLCLVIGLIIFPMVIRAQATGACSLWTLSIDTNYAGGTVNSAGSVSDCQSACIAQTTCVAIDWNTVQSTGSQCYILTSLSGTKYSGQNSKINHYDLNRACFFGSSVPSGVTTILPPTCIRWTASLNVNYAGGIANGASSVADCQSACLASSTCVAIDWNPNPSASSKCWLLNSLSGAKFSGTNSGITHYDLSKSCSSGAYRIIYSNLRQVAKIDPSTNLLTFVDDIRQATVFAETTCLATSITVPSGWNCVSWFPFDKPGYYLRQYLGAVTLQPLAPQLFPDRFAQDASFIVSPSNNSFSEIRPAVWSSIAGTYYVNGSNNLIIDTTGELGDRFNISSFPFPNLPITDSCSKVWTSISNVDTSQKALQSSLVPSTNCRKLCLVDPTCTGVVVTSSSCSLVSTTISYYLVPPPVNTRLQYTFYELRSARSSTRGRTFTWSSVTKSYKYSIITYVYNDVRTCLNFCLNTFNTYCDGISDPITSSNCTVYYNPCPAGTGCGLPEVNSSVTLLAPKLTFSAGGPCDPVIHTILFRADSAATLQVGVTGDDNCRTACVNNFLCRGFELDINNGNCYFSLTSNPNLSNSLTRHHFETILPSCGNGCQDKWDFYPNTRMIGATEQTGYTTERDCRLACQRLSTCTKVDWNFTNSKCYFGSSDTPLAPSSLNTGWNHYELFPMPYCNGDSVYTS